MEKLLPVSLANLLTKMDQQEKEKTALKEKAAQVSEDAKKIIVEHGKPLEETWYSSSIDILNFCIPFRGKRIYPRAIPPITCSLGDVKYLIKMRESTQFLNGNPIIGGILLEVESCDHFAVNKIFHVDYFNKNVTNHQSQTPSLDQFSTYIEILRFIESSLILP